MKSIKVSGLLEEIGTLYEDGTLAIDNLSLIKDGFITISEDIIVRLDSGKIMCGKNPCKKIEIALLDGTYETTTSVFLTDGKSIQDGEPKLSLHLQKWQHSLKPVTEIPNPPETRRDLKQLLVELKIDYLDVGGNGT